MADKAKATRIDHVRNNRTRCHFEIRRIKPGMDHDLFFFRLNKQLCGNNKNSCFNHREGPKFCSGFTCMNRSMYYVKGRATGKEMNGIGHCRRIQVLVVEFNPPSSRPPHTFNHLTPHLYPGRREINKYV